MSRCIVYCYFFLWLMHWHHQINSLPSIMFYRHITTYDSCSFVTCSTLKLFNTAKVTNSCAVHGLPAGIYPCRRHTTSGHGPARQMWWKPNLILMFPKNEGDEYYNNIIMNIICMRAGNWTVEANCRWPTVNRCCDWDKDTRTLNHSSVLLWLTKVHKKNKRSSNLPCSLLAAFWTASTLCSSCAVCIQSSQCGPGFLHGKL